MSKMRTWVAGVLIDWGYRLDPSRPTIRRDGSGFVIGQQGQPLAKVNIAPGYVKR